MNTSPLLATFQHHAHPFLIQFSENFGIRYYGVAYILGFVVGAWLLGRYYKNGHSPYDANQQSDLFVALIIGVVLGGRIPWRCRGHGLHRLEAQTILLADRRPRLLARARRVAIRPHREFPQWRALGETRHGGLGLFLPNRDRRRHDRPSPLSTLRSGLRRTRHARLLANSHLEEPHSQESTRSSSRRVPAPLLDSTRRRGTIPRTRRQSHIRSQPRHDPFNFHGSRRTLDDLASKES
jgi:hypothetical protein